MDKNSSLPGAAISQSTSFQKVYNSVPNRKRRPRWKIYLLGGTGTILLIVGLALSLLHFRDEDILGYDTLPKGTLNKEGQLIGDTTAPTVNPLQLPYFMAATVVMSFGLIFLVIAVTWLKLIWEKEERLGIRR